MNRIYIFLQLFAMSFLSLIYPKSVLIFIKAAVDAAGGMDELERMIDR